MSHAIVLADKDELLQCPYDPVHMVSQMRFPYHLIKCRKNHNGKEYNQCPFDAKHVILKKDFNYHVENCDKRTIIEPQLVPDCDRGEGIVIPESKAKEIEKHLSCEWDIEAPTARNAQFQRSANNTFTPAPQQNGTVLKSNNQNGARKQNYSSFAPQAPEPAGRGRGVAKQQNSFAVGTREADSYEIEVPNHIPRQPFSIGRGRGLAVKNLRRPGAVHPQLPTAGTDPDREKQRLLKKLREISNLEERVNTGGHLEMNQLEKLAQKDELTRELGKFM